MMKQEPLVSIITPLYNSEKFIKETLESVLNQTYKNWEMIIVDDCSSDRSVEIVEKYQQKDERIKLLKNKKNLGGAGARNRGIESARGKYIAFLDSDDLWKNNKLEKQIIFMEKNNVLFSYSNYERIGENGERLNIYSKIINKITYKELLYQNIIGCLTAVYNVEKLGKIFMPNIRTGQDYALWLEILKKAEIAYGINENLAYYRVRKGSLSKNKVRKIKNLYKMYRVYNNQSQIKSIIYLLTNTISRYFNFKMQKMER